MATGQPRPGVMLLKSFCLAPVLGSVVVAAAWGQNAPQADGVSSITVQTNGADEQKSVDCQVRPLVAAAFDFAFNPGTGELAAIEVEFGRLRVYPTSFLDGSTTAEPRTVSVGTRPVSVVLKEFRDRSYYIVACETDSELVVFDATTLEEIHRTSLPRRDLTRLWTSSNRDDPNVYYSFQLPGNAGVRVINAETWEDAGEIAEPGTLFGVSGDGRYLSVSGDRGNAGRSLTVDAGRVVQSTATRSTLQSHAHICVSDPHGLYLFVGQRFPFPRVEVLRADLSRQVNTLDYAILSFSRNNPWLVGYRAAGAEGSLVFASYPGLGTLFELGFPGTPLERQDNEANVQFANYRSARRFRVYCADERERLVIAFHQHVTTVPLANLNLPDGDVVHADLPLHAATWTGQELRIPIRTRPTDAQVQLRDPPEGVEIEDGLLHWTPGAEQIGKHAIEVDVSHADGFNRQWIEILVDRPSVTLAPYSDSNFSDRYLQIDPSGQRLLMVAQEATGETVLKLIDLESGETTATATLPQQSRVSRVTFPAQEQGGDLIVHHGPLVSLLPWPGLEQVTTLDLGMPFAIQNIVFVGDQWIVGGGQNGNVERRRLPDAERVPFPALIGGIHERTMNGAIGGISQELIGSRFGDGWISEGVHYDENLQTPKMLLRPWGFIRSERLDLTPLLRSHAAPPTPQVTAGNAAERVHYDDNRMQLVAVQETFQFIPPAGQTENYHQVVLETWSLTTRQQVESTPLCIMPSMNRRNGIRAFPGQNEALILVGDRLYRWPIPKSSTAEADADPEAGDGPQFGLIQSHLVADAQGRTEFDHTVTGGNAPYRFEVVGPRANREVLPVSIDADSGRVNIDGPRAVEWIMTHLRRPLEGANYPSLFEAYQSVASTEFERIVGRPPQGVPVLLGLSVTVTDTAGLTATMPYEFFIEVPRSAWQARLQQTLDQQQQAIARAQQVEMEAAEQRRFEAEQQRERERYGLVPPEKPVPLEELLWGLMLSTLLSLLALPLHVPISAVLLRAAFSLEMRFVMPSVEELELNAAWGPALSTSLATQGSMIFVAFIVTLFTQAVANLAALAPLYTAGLVMAQVLIAQWAIQATMVKLILKLRWRRAMRVSLYQILISVVIALICIGVFMAGLAILK